MYTVIKEFEFSAAHFLTKYKGKCENMHGHNYRLAVHVTAELNADDLVIDFCDLKQLVKREVISKLDHTNLNDTFENPSCELVAKWIYDQLKPHIPVTHVQLWETSTSSVIYSGK